MCIRRQDMPQIDAYFYRQLFAFLSARGLPITFDPAAPLAPMGCIQCLNDTRLTGIRDLVKSLESRKPLILCRGPIVLDGNTRRSVWLENGISTGPAYTIHGDFHQTLRAIKAFPHTRYSP